MTFVKIEDAVCQNKSLISIKGYYSLNIAVNQEFLHFELLLTAIKISPPSSVLGKTSMYYAITRKRPISIGGVSLCFQSVSKRKSDW